MDPSLLEAAQKLPRLLPMAPRVLVACSGGPDSQALLAWSASLARCGAFTHLGAVGVDHGLRAEAAAELALAAQLAEQLALPFVRCSVTVPAGGNVLAQARRVRLAALRAFAAAMGANVVLLGHTQDDRAETLLWHLLRGSSAAMHTAMPARRGVWRRPLLGVGRAALLAYLAQQQIPYAHDPSNDDPRRMRARLRARVWPALADVFADAKPRLCQAADAAAGEQALLAQQAARLLARARRPWHARDALVLPVLRRGPQALWPRVLRRFVAPHGLHASGAQLRALAAQIAGPLPARPGRAAARLLSLPGGTLALCEPHLWVCRPEDVAPRRGGAQVASAVAAPQPLDDAGAWVGLGPFRVRQMALPSLGENRQARLERLTALGALAPRGAITVAFAAERLHVALSLRPAKPSEQFEAFGGAGRVKVVDLLAQANVPQHARPGWPVVASAEEVVWVVGIRRGKQATIDVAQDGPVRVLQAEPLSTSEQP